MKLNLQRPLAFLDIETTGVNISSDRIVEISILKIHPDNQTASKTLRINPTILIPIQASQIHGIYDKDVRDKPKFSEVAKDLIIFLNDCDLGGYNSNRFDIPLMIEEFLRAGINFSIENRRMIDVQQIFHRKERRNLEAAYKFYCQKELNNAHQAEADVKATFEVLLAQLDRYNDLKNDVTALHEFTKDDDEFVDFARRMVFKNRVEVFNFGKHKGKAVAEVLKKEPSYYNWMMDSDFSLHTKQKLKEIKERMK